MEGEGKVNGQVLFMFCLIKLQVNRDERVNLIKRKQNKRAKGREWLPLSRVSFRSTSLHFFPRLSSLSFFCLKRMKWGEKGWKKKERWKEKWKKERKEHNSLHSSFICSFIRFTYNVMWVKAWSEPNKKRNEGMVNLVPFHFLLNRMECSERWKRTKWERSVLPFHFTSLHYLLFTLVFCSPFITPFFQEIE